MSRDLLSETNEPEFVERQPPFGLTPRAWVRVQLLVVFLFLITGVSFVFWFFADRDGGTEFELAGEPFDDVLRIDSRAQLACDSDSPLGDDESEHTHFRVLQTSLGISLVGCDSVQSCEAARVQQSVIPLPIDRERGVTAPENFEAWFNPSAVLLPSGEAFSETLRRTFEIDGVCHRIENEVTLRSIAAGENYELDEEIRFGPCDATACQVRRRTALSADGNL